MDALTIHEAAQTTGWSPRMLRYVERIGLVGPAALGGGLPPVRRRGAPAPAHPARAAGAFEIGLGELGFALRLRRDRVPARRGGVVVRGRAAASRARPAADWLRFEQEKHERLLTAVRHHAPPHGDRMTTTTTPRTLTDGRSITDI